MKKIRTVILLFLLTTSSCYNYSENKKQEGEFPLVESLTINVNESIQQLAISDDWAVVETPGKLTAIDITTQDTLWTLDDFSPDVDSQFGITEDIFTTVSYERILIVDRTGERKTVDLDPNGGDIIQLISTYPDYLYIIRGHSWNLEVYDISNNILLWETGVGRGQTNAFYDSQSGIAYIVTPRTIKAFENSNGKLLWERKTNVRQSFYDNGLLYLVEQSDNQGNFKFVAVDGGDGHEFWSKGYPLGKDIEICQLSLVQNMLVATTRFYYLAIDKNNGNQLWQSQEIDDIFYHSLIEYDKVLYARGSSGKLYAISIADGAFIGTVFLEENPRFQSRYESSKKVFKLIDGIAISTTEKIIVWKSKSAG